MQSLQSPTYTTNNSCIPKTHSLSVNIQIHSDERTAASVVTAGLRPATASRTCSLRTPDIATVRRSHAAAIAPSPAPLSDDTLDDGLLLLLLLHAHQAISVYAVLASSRRTRPRARAISSSSIISLAPQTLVHTAHIVITVYSHLHFSSILA